MIISKAIEILIDRSKNITTTHHEDLLDALKLGTEALKRIQYGRLHPFAPMHLPLTGESMPERGIKVGMQVIPNKKPQ